MSEESSAEAITRLATSLKIAGPKVARRLMLYKVEGVGILTALCVDRSTRLHGIRMESIQFPTALDSVIVVHSSINFLMREQNL